MIALLAETSSGVPIWAQIVFATFAAVVALFGGSLGLQRLFRGRDERIRKSTIETVDGELEKRFGPLTVKIENIEKTVEETATTVRDLPCRERTSEIRTLFKKVDRAEKRHCEEIRRAEERAEKAVDQLRQDIKNGRRTESGSFELPPKAYREKPGE